MGDAQSHNPGEWHDTVGVTWGCPHPLGMPRLGNWGVSGVAAWPGEHKAPRTSPLCSSHFWSCQKGWESCHIPGNAQSSVPCQEGLGWAQGGPVVVSPGA